MDLIIGAPPCKVSNSGRLDWSTWWVGSSLFCSGSFMLFHWDGENESWNACVCGKKLVSCLTSMDWGKSSPETIDFPVKHGCFRYFFPETNPLNQSPRSDYPRIGRINLQEVPHIWQTLEVKTINKNDFNKWLTLNTWWFNMIWPSFFWRMIFSTTVILSGNCTHIYLIICCLPFCLGVTNMFLVKLPPYIHWLRLPCGLARIHSIYTIFPESVWAKGSSNSGGLSNIFTSSHLLILTSTHLHILTSSHLLVFTSAHLHIFSSSHPHIFTSSHPHILTSSHLLILTSSYLHIFSSSHPHILTSSHPHIFTSSALHICSSSHLHITSSHHIFSSSHLFIFTSSHLHIFTSSHPHIFTSSHLALLPSCSLALLLYPSFLFLSWRRGAVPTRRHETQPFRSKRGSIAKN